MMALMMIRFNEDFDTPLGARENMEEILSVPGQKEGRGNSEEWKIRQYRSRVGQINVQER